MSRAAARSPRLQRTPAAPDSVLARRAGQGDVEAFTALYRRHSPWVYRIALTMCRDGGEAEDITQDTFIQVWRNLPGYRAESAVGTWIRRICINRCLAVGRRPLPRPTELLGHDVVADLPDPADEAVHAAEVVALRRAIAELPEPQRAALVLREFGQLRYEEVAEVLDISLTAARARIHRGRLDLVRRLGGTDAQPGSGSRPEEAAG